MSNVIDFQAKREERSKKNPKYVQVGTIDATFDIVYDIDYDKFLQMFTAPTQPKELE